MGGYTMTSTPVALMDESDAEDADDDDVTTSDDEEF